MVSSSGAPPRPPFPRPEALPTEASPQIPDAEEYAEHESRHGNPNPAFGSIPEDGPELDEGLAPKAAPDKPYGAATGLPDGQYSPLPWNQFFDAEIDVPIPGTSNVFHVYTAGSEGPVVLCIHGGGYSGLSFALAAARMKEEVRVVAPDLRGHGKTVTQDDADLSNETLCADVAALVHEMYGSSPPAIVLIGHSMGGAAAVRLAAQQEACLPSLAGLVVVDVVEGTALASLVHMKGILASRPTHFSSLEKAIEWSLRGGSLRNPESARASVPSTLRLDSATGRYSWRTRLEDSEPHWEEWYKGLSDRFMACHVPKLLLLAGTDRLDKVLTIGQMQGKFQMLVLRLAGHAIQEDEPDEFAQAVLAFVSRNRIRAEGVEIPGVQGPRLRS